VGFFFAFNPLPLTQNDFTGTCLNCFLSLSLLEKCSTAKQVGGKATYNLFWIFTLRLVFIQFKHAS